MLPQALLLMVLMSGGETTLRNVKTKYGPIQGVVHQPADNLQPVATFLGIPFAAPPLGNLRFMPPVTVSPWKETLLADKFAPVCPQLLPELTNRPASLASLSEGRLAAVRRSVLLLQDQSEDCLYLNVYAPAAGQSLQSEPTKITNIRNIRNIFSRTHQLPATGRSLHTRGQLPVGHRQPLRRLRPRQPQQRGGGHHQLQARGPR